MGIKGLTALISEHAPKAIRVSCTALPFSTSLTRRDPNTQEHDIKNLFGRKVAIDASMSIYQFLIAVRQQDGQLLTNEAGETTRCGRCPPVSRARGFQTPPL
jgi:flap endonuclease-1